MSRMSSRPFAPAAMLALFAGLASAMGGRPQQDDEATLARIQPLGRIELAGAPAGGAAAGGRGGEELYSTYCKACHGAGVANAPPLGDKAAWAPRIALGLDGLVKSAIAGKGVMPPKGGASDATPEELARAIAFMANKSGANFQAK